MRLQYIEIENFRSIGSLKIDFATRCRILVGINETRKTNILRALSLLEPQAESGDRRVLRFACGACEAAERSRHTLGIEVPPTLSPAVDRGVSADPNSTAPV